MLMNEQVATNDRYCPPAIANEFYCMAFLLSIAMSDHFEVCQSLKDLGSPNTHRRLGGALGLLYPTLLKMSSEAFPDKMVAAWLNRQDEVLKRSGEPTWSTLEEALKKIGQTGLAESVNTKRICHEYQSQQREWTN